jgi:hypothetical protein
VLDEARRLCRPTGTVLVGFRSGLERLRRRLPASLRSPPAIVLVALPTLRRPAFLLRASDRDAARYFVRRIALAYREPGDAGVRARLQQTRSQAALLAPATLALRGAPGRLAVLPGPEMPPSQLEAVGDLVLGSWTTLELPGRPPNWLAPLVVGHRRPTTGMVTVLLFRDGDRVPTVVAKLPRYSSNGTTMRREEEALEAVRLVLDGAVRDAVPRSLDAMKERGLRSP